MAEKSHHLEITPDFVRDFPNWLISGSPGRTDHIYSRLNEKAGRIESSRKLPIAVGYLHRGTVGGKFLKVPVGLLTSGMGMSSAEIVLQELLEARIAAGRKETTVIRVGSSGSHQSDIYGGDVVIANGTLASFGAVSDFVRTDHDSVSHNLRYATLLAAEKVVGSILGNSQDVNRRGKRRSLIYGALQYKLAAMEVMKLDSCDSELVNLMEQSTNRVDFGESKYHVGPVFSKQTLTSESREAFLVGAEEIRDNRLSYRERVLSDLGVYASEMEIGIMTSIARVAKDIGHKLRVGGVMAVWNNPRDSNKSLSPLIANKDVCDVAMDRAIKLGLESVVSLYQRDLMYS